MSEGPPSPKRSRLDMEDLSSCSREDLIEKLRELNDRVTYLQAKQRGSIDKDDGDDKDDDKLKQQNPDASRRENTLVLRLTNKEQELQDCLNQIAEMKASQTQNSAQLRSLLLDPAVNLVFQRMAKEMEDLKEKYKQTQNELSAWKFTADSQMGKRLMAKCRMLFQENEDLGKMLSSGRTSKLEAEIALQKTMVTEMKTNQDELNEFVSELEEDVEGMQSMIYVLQQQLKETKEHVTQLEGENVRLRTLQQQQSSVAVKQEPSSNCSGNAMLVDSNNSGADGGGKCSGQRCAPEMTRSVHPPLTAGTEAAGPGTRGSAPASDSAGSTSSTPHTVTSATVKVETMVSSPQQQFSPGQGRRTTTGGDDVDSVQQDAKVRTTPNASSGTAEVVTNNQHDCSLANADTSDLRMDQACDSVLPAKVGQQLLDSAAARDSGAKSDVKMAPSDTNPVRNGSLEVIANPGGASEN